MLINKRIFKGKDVEMLTVAETMVNNAIANKAALLVKRSSWADPFLPDMKSRIQSTLNDYMGVDNAKALRDATRDVSNYYQNSYELLMDLKIQIVGDFHSNKSRRDVILKELGYSTFLKNGKKPGRTEMIKWLYVFKNNMTTLMRDELQAKGISDQIIAALIENAEFMKKARLIQMNLKSNRPNLTQAANDELNSIYEEVMAMARIASKIFKDNKAVKAMFSYSNLMKQLGNGNKVHKTETAASQPQTINLPTTAA